VANTLDPERLDEVVSGLLDDDRLTKWERSFVESIGEQLDRGNTLSERQLEVLEKIWVRL
jgi:hypothetical protein